MIRFVLLLISFLVVWNVAEAKYNPPEGNHLTRSDVITNKYFQDLNTTQDGEMTLEQYKNRKYTREDRRRMRQDQKSGVYQTPEERFMEMDADEDGVVTKEEMADYIKGIREQNRGFY